MRAGTEEFERREDDERQLWEELHKLLADAVHDEGTDDARERSMMLALMGHDPEIHDLHEKIRRLARERPAGYLRAKLDEDNPVTAARRRLYGKWA
jgi:hypothetical protein